MLSYLLISYFIVVSPFPFLIPLTWANSYFISQPQEEFNDFLKNQMDEKIGQELQPPVEVLGWPQEEYDLGQIAGIDTDKSGNPIVFHRGTVIWDAGSFNDTNHYLRADVGPIEEDPIVALDAKNGQMLASWGGGLFYMPHGITIDANDNIWVTDVALHQVFKFLPGASAPILTLGEAFTPGTDNGHFCKPTDVAVVAKNGDFFVADGYCNSRIMKFDKSGKFLAKFGEEGWLWKEGKGSTLAIPHSLALIEEEDALCIADREHRRILCINAGIENRKDFGKVISSTTGLFIGRIFAISYSNGLLYGINGAASAPAKTEGLTIDWKSSQILETWTSSRGFISPHDISLSKDGHCIYIAEIGPNRITKFTMITSLIPEDQRMQQQQHSNDDFFY